MVKQIKNQYEFVPKGETKNVIQNIELSMDNNNSVNFFVINFTNMDTIKIEKK